MRSLRNLKTLSRILIFALLHLCWLASTGWAEMVPTEEAITLETPPQITREMLMDALNREDMQDQLQKYGISREEALARINNLTEEEIANVAGQYHKPSAHVHSSGQAVLILGTIYLLAFAVVLVSYPPGVIYKWVECQFSDCEHKGGKKYITRPWWDSGEDVEQADVEKYNPYSNVSLPSEVPVINVEPYPASKDCDPRQESCEWSVR